MRLFATVIAVLVASSFANAQDSPYAATAAKAFTERKPLVVFIGVKPRPIEGAITMKVDSLEGYDKMTVVVSKPGANWLEWTATMPAEVTDSEISRAVGLDRGGAVDALDEVNATRANRGLPPFVKDDGLTVGAMNAARF